MMVALLLFLPEWFRLNHVNGCLPCMAAHVMGVDVKEFSRRRRGSVLRGIAARCLCKYAGQTQREAAATLGIGSGAAVSMQMKKLSSTLPKDRKLRKLLMKVEEDLSRMQGEA